MKSFLSARVPKGAGGAAAVWTEVVSLSQKPNIVSNLGQGFPDFKGTKVARDIAVDTINNDVGLNQYSPVGGTARLRESLIKKWKLESPQNCATSSYTADKNVLVTSSGTEALYSAINALVNPGDEVIVFQPFFPWYISTVQLCGGVVVPVTLDAPTFEINMDRLAKKFSDKTKMVIFNTPHNPTGRVTPQKELEELSKLCIKHNVIVLSDEVYDHYLFGGRQHSRLAHVEGMANRTLTIGSASKMFSLTGWRVGWIYGHADIVSAISTIHAYNSYCAPTPLQNGVAAAVEQMCESSTSPVREEIQQLNNQFEENAKDLAGALSTLQVSSFVPEGGYFLVADVSATGKTDVEFFRWMAEREKGIICVPMSVFYDDKSGEAPSNLVRFAICKTREAIQAAIKAIRDP